MPSEAELRASLRRASGAQLVAVAFPGLGSATGATASAGEVRFWEWDGGDAWHRTGTVTRWDFGTPNHPQTLRGAYIGTSRTAVFALTGFASTGSSASVQVFAQRRHGAWGVLEKVPGGVGAVAPVGNQSGTGGGDPALGLWNGAVWNVEGGTLTLTELVLPPGGTTAGGRYVDHTYRADYGYVFLG